MKKIIGFLMAACIAIMLFSACGETTDDSGTSSGTENVTEENGSEANGDTTEKTTIRLGGLKGPTTMGMVKLLEDAETGTAKNNYEYTMAAAADEITPKFLKGELDIISVPANVGAVLYNKSKGNVQMAAINMLGAVYIAEKGTKTIQSIKDLKGKTILATGKGTTPEYVLTYILKENGMDIKKDVTMEWKSEPTETIAAMKNMDSAVAMLPEPFLTSAELQVEGLETVLDLYEEWNKVSSDSQYITAGVFVRKDFAEKNPEALKNFLEEYESSTKFVKENIQEAATLIEKQGIIKAAVAEKALPKCNIAYVTGEEMVKAAGGYLRVLYDQNPASVGSKLPEEDFFLNYE